MNHGAGFCAEAANIGRRPTARDARTSKSRSGEKPAPSNPAAKQSALRTADNARNFPATCCISSPTTKNRATAENGLNSADCGSKANKAADMSSYVQSRQNVFPLTERTYPG